MLQKLILNNSLLGLINKNCNDSLDYDRDVFLLFTCYDSFNSSRKQQAVKIDACFN
jgi:hypothetical protein